MMSSNDEESTIECVPFCEECLTGICVSPSQCLCSPGYQGDNCKSVCPRGTWGIQCKEKCNCTEDVPCNPVSGHCICPPGLRGQMCNESCPGDHWGPGCAFPCNCKDSRNGCHPETGRCIDDNKLFMENTSHPRDRDEENSVNANFTSSHVGTDTSRIWDTTTWEDDHEIAATTDNPGKATSKVPESVSSTDQRKIRTQTREDGNSSTVKPVIVWVSIPERRRNLDKGRGEFAVKNPFVRRMDDNLQDIGSSKNDYVKNIHKGDVQSTPIPLDIALIVVASIVSLGLTSVAVAMVLHMRSKLLEAARMSIYEEAKTKSQENPNAAKISSIVTATLPQTPIRLVPLFASTPETRTIPIDNDPNYANGAATIGLRLSGNLHGFFQEDHYDRPPATRIHLQSEFDADTEHVYDEIPLQSSPLSSRRNV
ncbi:nephronectin-like isoform X3 [Apis laboriosa]|nr:nephronectin-like isoform X3 [Apis laboriosa]